MNTSEFWQLTYAEFIVIYEEHIKSLTKERNNLVYQAWHIAMFERQKKLPSLESVLIKESSEPKKPQSTEEMISICKMLNAAYGGKEIKI